PPPYPMEPRLSSPRGTNHRKGSLLPHAAAVWPASRGEVYRDWQGDTTEGKSSPFPMPETRARQTALMTEHYPSAIPTAEEVSHADATPVVFHPARHSKRARHAGRGAAGAHRGESRAFPRAPQHAARRPAGSERAAEDRYRSRSATRHGD